MAGGPAGLFLRRLIHPLYRRLETDVRPLRYLFAEITQRCNLACLHCGSDCGKKPMSNELSTEEWLGFFSYLKDNFDTKKLIVVVTGGEPLCHPRFGEIARGLFSNGLEWGMVTNGYSLNQKVLDALVKNRVKSVTVSLDGGRESHDWLRGRDGAYDRAVGAIRRLVDSPVPVLDVVTCVNPRNLGELPEVLDTLRELGIRQWRLFLIFPKGRARESGELMLGDGQIRELVAWIAETRRGLRGSGFTLEFSCEGYFPGPVDRRIRNEPYFCRAGICIGSVLADGAISACPNISRSLVQGNIRDDDFKVVWEERFDKFRDRSWMRAGPCVECGHWRRCLGNSMHLWDDETGRTVRCFHQILK